MKAKNIEDLERILKEEAADDVFFMILKKHGTSWVGEALDRLLEDVDMADFSDAHVDEDEGKEREPWKDDDFEE